jgi:hypothetical protein
VPSRARGRFLLFGAPLSAVLVVLLGVVAGGDRPFRSARVYGGPTQGERELHLRVELGERDRVAEVPVPNTSFSVVALEGGQRVARVGGKTDELGGAEITLRLPRPRDSALELWVESTSPGAPPLARGLVLGRSAAFRNAAVRRGGFQPGRQGGDLTLAVAPAHGVLVTAQGALSDELVIHAERSGAAVSDARIDVKLEGAEPAEARVTTDQQGLARLALRPSESSVRVALAAFAEGIGDGMLAARFDVVQGAIRATRRGDRLLLESSGAAAEAWLGLFDEQRRYGGRHTALTLAPDGRLVAEVPLPPELLAISPLWAVVSSQADLASPSAVGWPVGLSHGPDPRTFDVRELRLLDGAPAARAREDKRARRIRLVTAGYAALALLLTLYVFVRRVRESDADIERHLQRAGADDAALGIAPHRTARTVLAAACIGLGFLVLALLALFKE